MAEQRLRGFFVLGNHRQRANALVVQTKVLGIGVGNEHINAGLGNGVQPNGIFGQPFGKALIGKVDQGQQFALGNDLCHLLPLRRR